MALAANITRTSQIAAYPFLIATIDPNVKTFLDTLPLPDFNLVVDPTALWSARARMREGTIPGSAYVVSAEAYKRIKAHRYPGG